MARLGPPRRRKPNAQELKEQDLAQALKELLEQLGFTVAFSRTLEGRGGDCLVHGEKRVILSQRLAAAEQVELLLDVVRRVDVSAVFVRPDLRELLEGPGRSRAS